MLKQFCLAGAMSCLVLSGAIAADVEPGPVDEMSFYVEFGGGVGFVPDADWEFDDESEFDIEYDTGFVLRGSVGAYLPHNFRAEIEGAYRVNDGDTITETGPIASVESPLNGDVGVWSIMANLFYDIDLGDFDLFVGGGLGYASLDFDVERADQNFTIADGTDDRFAYQLMAGASYDLTENTAVVLRYTYFDTLGDKVSVFNDFGGPDTEIDIPYENHSVTGGLRFSF
jgi:opacity protein-like surface antigen